MINGDVKQFIEDIHYENCMAVYERRTYYYNGCSFHIDGKGEKVFRFELYILDVDRSGELIYSVEGPTPDDCIEQFLAAKLFEGKTFYEVEKDMIQIG